MIKKAGMESSTAPNTRLSPTQIKQTGAHYTPPDLARFLGSHVASALVKRKPGYRVLDPACGDGQLLYHLAIQLSPQVRQASAFVAMENDPHALKEAANRLKSISSAPRFEYIQADFLEWAGCFRQPEMFTDCRHRSEQFDAVIANPPYVRTQVLGARSARRLAAAFGLVGRVDLYHAFACAMTDVLRPEGVLGLLCSNRFLTVQSGASLRRHLLESYDLHNVFDLGDTKLFEAAVLPAIVIGQKAGGVDNAKCMFTKIYEVHDKKATGDAVFSGVLPAIETGAEGVIEAKGCVYGIERGTLAPACNNSQPWRVSTPASDSWLAHIRRFAPQTFADHVKVRVGVKTTADDVFIRNDWQTLPHSVQPEPELLKPLLSNEIASKWWPRQSERQTLILYTHTIENGKRTAINLARFPRAKRYLESHKERLANRKYVIDAGRAWYEIWVPQNPADWQRPKVVFPDISDSPRFFLDRTGSVVDGNCYWFTADNEDYLYLMLAIGNSSFILRYYDLVCGNKLYAGRRRFITQYVEQFPFPDPACDIAQHIIKSAKSLCEAAKCTSTSERTIAGLDRSVWQLFGLAEELGR